jgi:hypothetical protein
MLGPMAELKTKPTGDDVGAYLQSVSEPMRSDCRELVTIMRAATGADPVMWGSSIVGFGSVHYRYASGREGDWFRVGFSPRKRNLTLYLMDGVDSRAEQLQRLGKHSTGKGTTSGAKETPTRRGRCCPARCAMRDSKHCQPTVLPAPTIVRTRSRSTAR